MRGAAAMRRPRESSGCIVSSGEREVTVLAPPSPAGPVSIALTNADGSFALAGTPFTFAD